MKMPLDVFHEARVLEGFFGIQTDLGSDCLSYSPLGHVAAIEGLSLLSWTSYHQRRQILLARSQREHRASWLPAWPERDAIRVSCLWAQLFCRSPSYCPVVLPKTVTGLRSSAIGDGQLQSQNSALWCLLESQVNICSVQPTWTHYEWAASRLAKNWWGLTNTFQIFLAFWPLIRTARLHPSTYSRSNWFTVFRPSLWRKAKHRNSFSELHCWTSLERASPLLSTGVRSNSEGILWSLYRQVQPGKVFSRTQTGDTRHPEGFCCFSTGGAAIDTSSLLIVYADGRAATAMN